LAAVYGRRGRRDWWRDGVTLAVYSVGRWRMTVVTGMIVRWGRRRWKFLRLLVGLVRSGRLQLAFAGGTA